MQYLSTRNPRLRHSFEQALFNGLAPDGGLYMPTHYPTLDPSFFESLPNLSFTDLAYQVGLAFLGEEIPERDFRDIVSGAFTFPIPLKELAPDQHILEVFHGPSMAFKDVGARFMAACMSYFIQRQQKEITILTATSGDTGAAVAAGFHQAPGIRVVILYPSKKVSAFQESQITGKGDNIYCLEVDGNFDDCQRLVKEAFQDDALSQSMALSSANSINIARLIPQSFYYYEAYKQLKPYPAQKLVFAVPSGNFGNLTAGLIAARMGLPVWKFLAATNKNDVVPEYLDRGQYQPRPSVPTLANAMDVGNPSNFERMLSIYSSTWNKMKEDIKGYHLPDEDILDVIHETWRAKGYFLDPHTAIAWHSLEVFKREHPEIQGVAIGTAHPRKFISELKNAGMQLPTSFDSPLSYTEKKNTYGIGPKFQYLQSFLREHC